MDQIVIDPESGTPPAVSPPSIPKYLIDTYDWAYLNPTGVRLLDRDIMVRTILWGNANRLMQAAFKEFKPGEKVLQAAQVYGQFSANLARHIGPEGQLDVVDIVPLQVKNCGERLKDFPWARARLADAAEPGGGPYDAICCYFLLHEMPHQKKVDVVRGLLESVRPGGRVCFVDYHKPARCHPLRGLMGLIWRKLEPYAIELTETDIKTLAGDFERVSWSKETFFGGLYQKVVATRSAGQSVA
ncbi:rhodoquinone biosynthesis methyltransferase RquA [Magnetospira sp. QH-2]|uniref:rhodoquinone biosynthesis methyltransferase RquA n=1 Tax=Magnetospira sp. (strain QH-2) TaxID=1288970 RepID=UPI0003E80CCF|nr:rhodoquinone biosynthesis methyltransferase RquA [Magnetospira sp. QH-2]CCQ75199.1 conserved protein of unknown function[Include Methyltransferase domain] [Magnetospira sp. QH-2]